MKTENCVDPFQNKNNRKNSAGILLDECSPKRNKNIITTYISQLLCCIGKRSERNETISSLDYKSTLPKEERKVRSTPLETLRKESMLSPRSSNDIKTLVLDLDETLIHAEFTETECDFYVDFVKNCKTERAYIKKRPGVDHFLKECSKSFEIVVFTASRSYYAYPILDELDKQKNIITKRLYREHCTSDDGINFVKDLSTLGRNLDEIWIIDNTPFSYSKHPENALPISTWIDDPNDTALIDLLPVLEKLAKRKKSLFKLCIDVSKCSCLAILCAIEHSNYPNDQKAAAISKLKSRISQFSENYKTTLDESEKVIKKPFYVHQVNQQIAQKMEENPKPEAPKPEVPEKVSNENNREITDTKPKKRRKRSFQRFRRFRRFNKFRKGYSIYLWNLLNKDNI
eukprot:gene6701-10866_t